MEFQAIVFAGGRGSRYPDLIGDRPKCLLPIGPIPIDDFTPNSSFFCCKNQL